MQRLWLFLHLFFAFSYVGSLVVADWNGRAARRSTDWAQRSLLWDIVRRSGLVGGLGSLALLGVFGNLAARGAGVQMSSPWMMIVNGLWVVGMLLTGFAGVPAARRLTALSAAVAAGGTAPDYDRVLKVWRWANVVQSVFYLTMLALMVYHPGG
jgi:hypothetical protein